MSHLLYAIVLFGFAALFYGLRTASRRAIHAGLACHTLFLGIVLSTFDTPSPLFLTAFGPVALSLCLWLIWISTHLHRNTSLARPMPDLALRMIGLWYIAETLTLIDLSVPPDASALAALYHPLAPLHIWTSILARATLILALCHAAFQHSIPKPALTLSLLLQAISLFSGILWAQDTWLVGWHWDPIETLSLITLIATAAACRTRAPAWLFTAALSLVGTLCITNGAFSSASRHSYGIDQPLFLAFHAAFIVTLLWQFIHAPRLAWMGEVSPHAATSPRSNREEERLRKQTRERDEVRRSPLCGAAPRNAPEIRTMTDAPSSRHRFDPLLLYLSYTSIFILIIIIFCTLLGALSNASKLSYLFSFIFLFFAFINYKNTKKIIFCIILSILISLYSFITTPATQHTLTPIAIQTPAGSATLLDIDRTKPISRAIIRIDMEPKELSFFEERPLAHTRAFYLHNNRLWRISADAYTPSVGLTVRITDVTFFGIWLFLVMICSGILLHDSTAPLRPRKANTPQAVPDTLS